MTRLYTNSIYLATEGEGIWLGSPQIFVRLQGCQIGCVNCDSKDTWSFEEGGKFQSLEEILSEVHRIGFNGKIRRVSITGGDPLHPKHESGVLELVKVLKKKEYWLNIEAAGTRVVDPIFDRLDYISFDIKTPSTGIKTQINLQLKMIDQYAEKTQFKAVIQNREDFDYVLNVHEALLARSGSRKEIPFVLTPCFEPGEAFPQERFQEILKWNLNAGGIFRVIGQQHKWIFGSDQKQV